MARLLILLISPLLILAFLGCTQLGPHRVAPDKGPNRVGKIPKQDPIDQSRSFHNGVHFVEFDEFGNSFSREQLNSSLLKAEETLRAEGTVIVYVHGWHHSAKEGDPDIKEFEKLVSEATRRSGKEALGVYVGWRGDSIDAQRKLTFIPSYLLTFWDRKAAAHNIGHGGGVAELVRKLSAIRANSRKGSRLVLVGHSFGGAIVYSAVSQLLAEQINMDAAKCVGRDKNRCSENEVAKGVGEGEVVVERNTGEYFRGNEFVPIADLVVLLNPAFEAMRLAPLYALARSQEYKPNLPPRLVMITTTADWATKITFPIGRWLGTALQGYPAETDGALNRVAIGHYKPFITHQLALGDCPHANPFLKKQDPKTFLTALNEQKDSSTVCFDNADSNKDFVLTRCDAKNSCNDVAKNHYLERGAVGDGLIPNRFPIANIRTTADIMEGHSTNWAPEIKLFLENLLVKVIDIPRELPTNN